MIELVVYRSGNGLGRPMADVFHVSDDRRKLVEIIQISLDDPRLTDGVAMPKGGHIVSLDPDDGETDG